MFYEKTDKGIILRVRVTPNSSKCAISGIFKDSTDTEFLKINLNSVPEKGKANQELIKFLSKLLKLSKASFSILSGETDRYKRILIETLDFSFIESTLKTWSTTDDSSNS